MNQLRTRPLTIACLQINAHWGTDVYSTIRHADSLLAPFWQAPAGPCSSTNRIKSGFGKKPDILVLPELAFTGYGFPSRQAIGPYLEPTVRGVSTQWAQTTARRIGCHVIVGYPERPEEGSSNGVLKEEEGPIYNSAVVVGPSGTVLYNYRKHFLYEADEKWGASPGQDGFGCLDLKIKGSEPQRSGLSQNDDDDDKDMRLRVVLGLCMDLNPEKFEAPFTKFEFGNFAVTNKADLIIMPMAWLAFGLGGGGNSERDGQQLEDEPDWKTVHYWARRLTPVVSQYAQAEPAKTSNTIFVASNRCGTEDNRITYAGSSSVLRFCHDASVQLIATLPKESEGVLITDVEI
ncbi:carbon-nitrogen hydrolase [Lipomyces kononenkoae]|uniref:Carbon-nitrogen hydrolase n=1 Tax=Lipomyces kononenkoae TaxID=34357 RepID=A0ACC3T1E5_LIPKO